MMRMLLILGLSFQTLSAISAAEGKFLFLMQSEAPKYGVTRASVDPVRFDASVETAVYRGALPQRHLVHTWHVMDSKVLLLVPNDRESTAEFFRRQCGFVAWQGDADGVLVSDSLSPARQRALAEAKKDVASCERLKELAEKCLAKPEPVHTEGRRANAYLYLMRTGEADLDYLRLENVVRAERLAKLLGESCGLKREVAAPYDSEKPEPAFDPADFTELKLSVGRRAATLKGGPYGFAATTVSLVKLAFSGEADRPLGKPANPGGRWQLKLWLMTPEGFLPYRYQLDLRRDDEREKPIERPGAIFCNLERRFGTSFEDARASDGVKDVAVRTPSPDYPYLAPRLAVHGIGERGWEASVTLDLTPLRRRLPATTVGREDVWYAELVDPAGKAMRVKLVWPVPADAAAAEANRRTLSEKIDEKKIEEEYKDRVLGNSDNKYRRTSVTEEWLESGKVTGFGFTTDQRETDKAFYEQCLKPLLEAKEKSGEVVSLSEFRPRVEKARKEFLLK